MADFLDQTVREYMGGSGSKDTIVVVTQKFDSGECNVFDITKALQPWLDDNATLPDTSKALGLLSAILRQIKATVDRVDVHELVLFFSRRLQNSDQFIYRAGIQESAEALYTLVNHDNGKKFMAADVETVIRAVLAVDTNDLLRTIKPAGRLALYNLLSLLMKRYQENINKNVGRGEFTEGLVSMAELEKDPSNLKAIFLMYEDLSRNWKLDSDTYKKIWESFSRYFPITLARASTDPNTPKPEELRSLLLNCIISDDVYATHIFPRLIDMLDTSQDLSANVKKDVLETMAACISEYRVSMVREWAQKIWDSLKFEIWNGENEEFISGSLSVLNALATKLSSQEWIWDDETGIQARLIIVIYKECTQRILDSERYLSATGRILYALMSASPYMFQWGPKKVFPSLLTLWEGLASKSEKVPLLGFFNLLLQARTEVDTILEDIIVSRSVKQSKLLHSPEYAQKCKVGLDSCMAPFRERLVDIYFSAMTGSSSSSSPDHTAFRIAAIQGLTFIMAIPSFLADTERGMVIQTLNNAVLKQDEINKIQQESVSALRQISILDPVRFHDITLANFAMKLPDAISQESELDSGCNMCRRQKLICDETRPECNNCLHGGFLCPEYQHGGHIIRVLDALMEIACTAACSSPTPANTVFDDFVQTLLNKLFIVLRKPKQIAYGNVILIAILCGLQKFDTALDNGTFPILQVPADPSHHPYVWIVQALFQELVAVKQVPSDDNSNQVTTPYIGLRIVLGDEDEDAYRFVSLVSAIATSILRSNQTTPANNFLRGKASETSLVWSLFCKDVPDHINETQMILQWGPPDKYLVNSFSVALVAGTRQEDQALLKIKVGDVALAMIEGAIYSKDNHSKHARLSMLYFLQLLVNKFSASKEILASQGNVTLGKYMEQLAHTASIDPEDEKVERIYQVIAYYATAALARCDPSDRTVIQQMVAGLEHKKLGRKVAQSFRMLLAPSEALQKANFHILRPLRNGRLHTYVVGPLIAKWQESADSDVKVNCLIALVGVLSYMETSVYLDNINVTFPLLLESTNQNDAWTKVSCINIIRGLIPACPELITSHLDSIINRMTDRTRNTYFSPSDANPECRAAALDVLALLTKYVDKPQLVKRKVKVMGELDIALDDASVIVRERAQRCKLAWFKQVGLVEV